MNQMLVATIVFGIGLAFVFGTIANRLRISPIAGYLLAGVAVGPFTPGFVADPDLAQQLASIGIILLMFGVGLHFSIRDLLSLRRAFIPVVFVQMAISTALGGAIAGLIGLPGPGRVVFGLALAVASTVVLSRELHDRRLLETERGRLTTGWMIIQDFFTIIAMVLIPALSGLVSAGTNSPAVEIGALAETLAITFGKIGAFVLFMWVVGRRVIPWVLHYVAYTGSRELFRLAVLSVALGVAALATELFGISFALGAFFAGMILSESQLSQRAAEETLPLRDAFAVLFFVSIGMLFNPAVLIEEPLALATTVLVVMAGNSVIAFALARLLGYAREAALLAAVGLSQIGEFSFVLADLGIRSGIMTPEARNLILGASIMSIFVNPFLFSLLSRFHPAPRPGAPSGQAAEPELHPTTLESHVILVGHGRVGSVIGQELKRRNEAFLVIEDADQKAASLREQGIEVLEGNAVRPEVLAAANVRQARLLFLAIPNGFEAGQIVEQSRALNPKLKIIARAHSDDEVEYLTKLSADAVVMGEREIAHGMIEHAFAAAPAEAGPAA